MGSVSVSSCSESVSVRMHVCICVYVSGQVSTSASLRTSQTPTPTPTHPPVHWWYSVSGAESSGVYWLTPAAARWSLALLTLSVTCWEVATGLGSLGPELGLLWRSQLCGKPAGQSPRPPWASTLWLLGDPSPGALLSSSLVGVHNCHYGGPPGALVLWGASECLWPWFPTHTIRHLNEETLNTSALTLTGVHKGVQTGTQAHTILVGCCQ